jgi:1,4-dihydroxy-2-naphthoate octaprenyltransferase
MWDSRDDISTRRRQSAVMASKSLSEDMSSSEAPFRLDIPSASTTTSSRDRQSMHDLPLVALVVASGMADAISYFGLGRIFSAFMTGNLVFLGFGIAETESLMSYPPSSRCRQRGLDTTASFKERQK